MERGILLFYLWKDKTPVETPHHLVTDSTDIVQDILHLLSLSKYTVTAHFYMEVQKLGEHS